VSVVRQLIGGEAKCLMVSLLCVCLDRLLICGEDKVLHGQCMVSVDIQLIGGGAKCCMASVLYVCGLSLLVEKTKCFMASVL
jgi:hypothetical protein